MVAELIVDLNSTGVFVSAHKGHRETLIYLAKMWGVNPMMTVPLMKNATSNLGNAFPSALTTSVPGEPDVRQIIIGKSVLAIILYKEMATLYVQNVSLSLTLWLEMDSR